jgi:hypothetical protein
MDKSKLGPSWLQSYSMENLLLGCDQILATTYILAFHGLGAPRVLHGPSNTLRPCCDQISIVTWIMDFTTWTKVFKNHSPSQYYKNMLFWLNNTIKNYHIWTCVKKPSHQFGQVILTMSCVTRGGFFYWQTIGLFD